jgi:hypothetical protein
MKAPALHSLRNSRGRNRQVLQNEPISKRFQNGTSAYQFCSRSGMPQLPLAMRSDGRRRRRNWWIQQEIRMARPFEVTAHYGDRCVRLVVFQ